MTVITFEQAVEGLKRAVLEKGEDHFVAGGQCVYFSRRPGADGGRKPSCLVGHVFAYAGMTLDSIGAQNNGIAISFLVDREVVHVDDSRTRKLLSDVQNWQDGGTSWGLVVEKVLTEMGVPA